jgi:DNA modification methylase
VTSPPYFGLRDYGNPQQIGLEQTPDAYVASLVQVFREVRRVLKDDSTVWLNLGDSYNSNSSNQQDGAIDSAYKEQAFRAQGRRNKQIEALKAKNLLGIPWRVAFALQAPYVVPSCVKAECDRAWLAAMFDGEGCIGIRRFDSYRAEKQQVYQDGFVVYTVVTNNDRELLDRCVELTGMGSVRLKQRAASTDGRGIVSRRDSFGWRLDGNKSIDVIAAIYPYLIAKRKQACIVYTLDQLNKTGHGSRVVPTDVQGKKQHLWELVKRCNQREPVDLPDWIQEPKQIVEPGWYLRSDIIWHKPNPMPESVTDRPTKAHEYVFLLSKSERYVYDADAIRESLSAWEMRDGQMINMRGGQGYAVTRRSDIYPGAPQMTGNMAPGKHIVPNAKGRNKRSVWTIPTSPFSGAHFATMPEALVEPCILAGCPLGGLVLDPFLGSGTVGAVAERLGRRWVGTDLSYQPLSKSRTAQRGIRFEPEGVA